MMNNVKLFLLANGFQVVANVIKETKSKIEVEKPIIVVLGNESIQYGAFVDTNISDAPFEFFVNQLLAAPVDVTEEMREKFLEYWKATDEGLQTFEGN